MSSKRPLKIIVIGGGVAGLTLANMLEKFEVDYDLLEAHDEIDPPTGAGIGLMPNGSYILDQLGCYEAIRAAAQDGEIENSHVRSSSGRSLISLKHMMYHQAKRHGYPMLFFDRQWYLKVLYDELKHKDRIHLRSRVNHIEPVDGGIQVKTKDSCYVGDIVIGADGIHSSVRREMRRIADATDPTYFETGEEDNVPCYYQCSFGIAQDVDGWPGNEQGFTTGYGKSMLAVSGPAGRLYWFLFVRLPEVKYGKQIPRYSKEDEARFVEENASMKVRENLNFGQIYAKRVRSGLTPLHEVVFKKWFFGRIFLMGDSAHKPNPIGGMGANAAIETAAEFINALMDLKAFRQGSLSGLTCDEITAVFKRVEAARITRANFTISSSHDFQALNSHENFLLATLVWKVLMPLAGKHNFFRDLSARTVGASRLKHLDPPPRPHALPYDHELPARPLDIVPRRVAWGVFSCAMSFLFYTANSAMNVSPDELTSWGELGLLDRNWLGATGANDVLKMLTSLLSFSVLASDITPRVQLIYLLSQLLSPILVFTVEGYRIGRHGSSISIPIIFTTGLQVLGLCKTMPLFALLSALQSDQNPVDRAVPTHVARSLVPALVLGFVIPTILMLTPIPDQSIWQDWTALWQVAPPLVSVLVVVFSSALVWWRGHKGDRYPMSVSDRERHPEWYSTDDVPTLKTTYLFASATQASAHLATLAYVFSHQDLSFSALFWDLPNPFRHEWNLATLSDKIFVIFKFDLLLGFAAIAAHNLYSVWELRRQGYIATSTATMAAFAVTLGQVFLGSGATWAILWSWREDVMAGLSVLGEGKTSR